MLQIITGKFYSDAHRYDNNKTIRLYSNAKIEKGCHIGGFYINPIISDDGGINAYDVNFNNQIEQQTPTFSLVDIGCDVVVYQLKCILSFYLDAFFDDDMHIVKKLCIDEINKSRLKTVPSKFLRTTLDLNKLVDSNEIENANNFINDLIGLQRKDYEVIISCISTYYASIKMLEDEPNLAYCTLVFALESMSQSFDEYEPTWKDYAESKPSIEKILNDLDNDKAETIRLALTADAHLKLTQRFLNFVTANIDDKFYFDERISNKILKDDMRDALKNAYNFRSKYTHALKIIRDQSNEDATSKVRDYYAYFQEPYFTFSGLLRLTRYVIINFTTCRDKIEKESMDWVGCLPGMQVFQAGPDLWLSKLESPKCLKAKKRFEGFVLGLTQGKIYDINKVIELYIKEFASTKEEYKKPIFSLCVIWNEAFKHLHENTEKEEYKKFIENNKSRFKECCIENAVMYAVCSLDYYPEIKKWNRDKFASVLTDYMSKRHSFKNYMFPNIIETLLYLLMSSFFEDEVEKMEFWISKARYNSANNYEVLKIINENMPYEEINEKIWNIQRKKTAK